MQKEKTSSQLALDNATSRSFKSSEEIDEEWPHSPMNIECEGSVLRNQKDFNSLTHHHSSSLPAGDWSLITLPVI